jgi:metal-responsive CopG/Arc/MetJ family transcriptional regulator
LQVVLPTDELAAIDEFRFQARMPSRSAAVRELLRRGLIASGKLKRGLKPRKATPDQ